MRGCMGAHVHPLTVRAARALRPAVGPVVSFFPPLPNPKCGKRCTHPLKTPRWQLAQPQLLALGRKLAFTDKIDRAVFTGNMKTSPNRQTIFHQAERHPELLFVNEVYIKTSPPSCFAINEPNVTNGGVLVKKCAPARVRTACACIHTTACACIHTPPPSRAFTPLPRTHFVYTPAARLHFVFTPACAAFTGAASPSRSSAVTSTSSTWAPTATPTSSSTSSSPARSSSG